MPCTHGIALISNCKCDIQFALCLADATDFGLQWRCRQQRQQQWHALTAVEKKYVQVVHILLLSDLRIHRKKREL